MSRIAPLTLAACLQSAALLAAEPAPGGSQPPQLLAPPGASKGLVLYLADSPADRTLLDRLQQLTYTVALVDAGQVRRQPGGEAACRGSLPDFKAVLAGLRRRFPTLPRQPPILLGSGNGGQLVYQALAAAGAGDFHAGISLDFCPPAVPADCAAETGPAHLPVNWYVFQAAPACDAGRAAEFVGRIDNAKLVDHTGAAGGPQALRTDLTALLQWLDPGIRGQVAAASGVAGMPLTEVRAQSHASSLLAVMLSGDGGWAAIDRGIAAALAKQGVDTVGWDSLSYFWSAKTPEQAARDLERVIAHYSRAWNKSEVLLIGYSFGADALPFIIRRLSPETRGRVRLAAFLGLGLAGSFEFHLSDWLGGASTGQWPTQPELRKLGDIRRLCVYGADETASGCPGLEDSDVRVVKMSGDHHFDGAYGPLADRLLQELR